MKFQMNQIILYECKQMEVMQLLGIILLLYIEKNTWVNIFMTILFRISFQ